MSDLTELFINKLDKMNDKVNEISIDVKEHKFILNDVRPIIEEYKFDKELRSRRKKRLAIFGTMLALTSTFVGLLVTFAKFF